MFFYGTIHKQKKIIALRGHTSEMGEVPFPLE